MFCIDGSRSKNIEKKKCNSNFKFSIKDQIHIRDWCEFIQFSRNSMYAIKIYSQLELINYRKSEASFEIVQIQCGNEKAIYFFKKYDLLHFDEIVTV